MRQFYKFSILFVSSVLFTAAWGGCQSPSSESLSGNKAEGIKLLQNKSVGQAVRLIEFEPLRVEGYGLVGGLAGTGSSDCPPDIRDYLRKYILAQTGGKSKINPDELINSPDTAVVYIRGIIPAAASKGEHFDLWVSLLSGSQATSLDGGRLYGADLRFVSRNAASKIVAYGEGQVFLDKIGRQKINLKTGGVLGGGLLKEDMPIKLSVVTPNYISANIIQNRINERFGPGNATATSPGLIILKPQGKYATQKNRFINLATSLYLPQDRKSLDSKVKNLLSELKNAKDKTGSELALEAIGKISLDGLEAMLNDTDEDTRFHAARCMLNLSDDRALETLYKIASDKQSTFRIEAIETIGLSASRDDAITMLNSLLGDDNKNVQMAVYRQILRLDDASIKSFSVSDNFYVNRVFSRTERKTVYAQRMGEQKIVLFGSPIICKENSFIESKDGELILNTAAGAKEVTLIRKHPRRPGSIGTLKCSNELADIITTFCSDALPEKIKSKKPGLGVSYSEILPFLQTMCEKGAINAEFIAGPGYKTPDKNQEKTK